MEAEGDYAGELRFNCQKKACWEPYVHRSRRMLVQSPRESRRCFEAVGQATMLGMMLKNRRRYVYKPYLWIIRSGNLRKRRGGVECNWRMLTKPCSGVFERTSAKEHECQFVRMATSS